MPCIARCLVLRARLRPPKGFERSYLHSRACPLTTATNSMSTLRRSPLPPGPCRAAILLRNKSRLVFFHAFIVSALAIEKSRTRSHTWIRSTRSSSRVLDFSLRQLIRLVRRFIEHVLAATSSVSSTVHDLSTPSWRIIDLPKVEPEVRSRVQYETYLAAALDRTTSDFVWIVHPPAVLQPSNRRFQKWWADGFELFMPYGRGELASGGVRDRQYSRKYVSRWSAAANPFLPAISAGFGLGVERFVGLLSGHTDLRRVVLPHTRSSVRSRGK